MLLERVGLEVNMNIMYNCGFERGGRWKNDEMWHWKVQNVDSMKVIIYAWFHREEINVMSKK
jgi:hypothetical protein